MRFQTPHTSLAPSAHPVAPPLCKRSAETASAAPPLHRFSNLRQIREGNNNAIALKELRPILPNDAFVEGSGRVDSVRVMEEITKVISLLADCPNARLPVVHFTNGRTALVRTGKGVGGRRLRSPGFSSLPLSPHQAPHSQPAM